MRIDQGKRATSAALSTGPKMNLFSQGLAGRAVGATSQTLRKGRLVVEAQPRTAVAGLLCPGLFSYCPSGAPEPAAQNRCPACSAK